MGLDFIPTGVATGLSGSIMAKEVTTTIGAGLTFIPAAGVYYAYGVGADVKYQIQDSGGTWRDVSAVTVGGLIVSDGTNTRYINGGGGNETVSLIKIG